MKHTDDVAWARDFIARAESLVETHGDSFGSMAYPALRMKLEEIRSEIELTHAEAFRTQRADMAHAVDVAAAEAYDAGYAEGYRYRSRPLEAQIAHIRQIINWMILTNDLRDWHIREIIAVLDGSDTSGRPPSQRSSGTAPSPPADRSSEESAANPEVP